MKMVKSLLLGTAAGLVAMSGAQAADLPVKAKPVQYVKICSLYGAGFYYIPGTDTCIKIGGWVRAEVNINSLGSFNPYHAQNLDARSKAEAYWRTRAMTSLDVRSQTEYGTLRSYLIGGWQWDNGAPSAPGPANDGGNFYLYRGFVQLGGFTAGRSQSFFDFYSTPAYSNTTNVWGSDTGGGGDNVFAYTAQFGNGLSATISAEDSVSRRNNSGGGVVNGTAAIFNDAYAGNQWPDVVANLRVDQAWGSAQVMGALHQVRTLTNTALTPAQDEVGYAVGGGVTVNLPMLGKGDSISTQVTWAKGALNYVGSGLASGAAFGNGFVIQNGAPVLTSSGLGPVADATLIGAGTGATSLDLTQGWSIVGGFQHAWTPTVRSSLYGTYGAINYSDAASIAAFGVTGASWSMWQAGSRTIWNPVANLDLSVDVMYNHLNTAFDTPGLLFAGAPISDKSWWQGMFRVQRNFWP